MLVKPSYLYEGKVYHKRLLPKPHEFTHSVFYVDLDIDRPEESANSFFSVDSWNLLSFYRRDHGRYNQDPKSSDGNLRRWVEWVHETSGASFKPTTIRLQAFPRVLGYVFNPISVWYCYNHKNQLTSVICEVNNTFGETHNYLLIKPDLSEITAEDVFQSDKSFHVSPFFKVRGHYKFIFKGHPLSEDQSSTRIDITYFDGESNRPSLVTWLEGQREPLTRTSAARAFFKSPLLTLKVIGLIHAHALILWFKRAHFFSKPAPPKVATTAGQIKPGANRKY